VLGLASQLFEDEEAAAYIEAGSHLMPWLGDESNMVDRYDARLLMEPDELTRRAHARAAPPAAEEDADEERLDEERYRDLDYGREHEVAVFGGAAPAPAPARGPARRQRAHHGEPPAGRPGCACLLARRARCGLRRPPTRCRCSRGSAGIGSLSSRARAQPKVGGSRPLCTACLPWRLGGCWQMAPAGGIPTTLTRAREGLQQAGMLSLPLVPARPAGEEQREELPPPPPGNRHAHAGPAFAFSYGEQLGQEQGEGEGQEQGEEQGQEQQAPGGPAAGPAGGT
jgi:hypothetical protein